MLILWYLSIGLTVFITSQLLAGTLRKEIPLIAVVCIVAWPYVMFELWRERQ